MSTNTYGPDVSTRTAARIGGYGYLAIFGLAIFANFFVRSGLVERGDALATARNIADSEGLFRAGLVAFLIVFVLDVAIAWALYVVFRGAGRDLSLLTAWFRLVYTVFLGVALVSFFTVLQLLSGEDYLRAFPTEQLDAQVLLHLDAFNAAWLIGLACFGVHLVLLGALVRRSSDVPSIIGLLLVIAGVAYVVDTLANALLANYRDHESLFLAIVAVPSVIGEMSLGLWLLLRGGRARSDADRSDDAAPLVPQQANA